MAAVHRRPAYIPPEILEKRDVNGAQRLPAQLDTTLLDHRPPAARNDEQPLVGVRMLILRIQSRD
jgi:hypothetical protein